MARTDSDDDGRLSEVWATVVPQALPGVRVRDLRRLSGGSKKGVYRVTRDDGSTVVIYRWHRAENYWPATAEADVQGALGDASGLGLFLASHAELLSAGVEVPRLLCASEAGASEDGWAVVEDASGGNLETALARGTPVGDRAVRDLAGQVRALHAATSERPGKVAMVRGGGGSNVAPQLEVLGRAEHDLAGACERVDALRRQRSLIDETLAERVADIHPRGHFALIHGELGPDHVLLRRDGRPIVIDIEGAMFFDIEWEHAFLELRFGRSYQYFENENLDRERLRFYRLSMYLSLVAGPLRLLDGDFPDRDAMRRIADANVARLLTDLASGSP